MFDNGVYFIQVPFQVRFAEYLAYLPWPPIPSAESGGEDRAAAWGVDRDDAGSTGQAGQRPGGTGQGAVRAVAAIRDTGESRGCL